MTDAFDITRDDDGVATIELQQGERPVVVLDGELIERLDATIDLLLEQGPPAGVVLASRAPRAFVAGADLKSIMAMGDEELHAYLERGADVFARLAKLPCPTAAAIHGVCLGGGLELAMHCDALVGCATEKPFAIGLPEAGLGICPGWGGTQMLGARMDASDAIARTISGTPLTSVEAHEGGLFDAWAGSVDDLRAAAAAWVRGAPAPARDGAPSRWIGRDAARTGVADAAASTDDSGSGPSRAVLDCIAMGLESGWAEGCARERKHLVNLRHTPDASERIRAFFDRGAKRANK
ncbi:MAG: enoyl-CoA hydratase/isomerase family protein [Planctomycetota bacterium]